MKIKRSAGDIKMSMVRARIALVFACAIVTSHVAHAQVTFDDEYDKRLKASQTISPGGDTPFGEQINLYTGELSFRQTDVDYEGTGPSILINRSTVSSQKDRSTDPLDFGTWELSIPRIETLIRGSSTNVGPGWGRSEDNYARCSNIGDVLTMGPEAWHGIEFISSEGTHHEILSRVPEYTAKPSISINGGAIPFTALTLDNWQFGCLSSVDNDVGEGFLAVSPDGTRYWLNHLVGKPVPTYRELTEFGWIRTFRALAIMYVTRIEDRFGNSIYYHYTGDKLTSVTADDGREVQINWRSDARLVQSVVQQPQSQNKRTWSYTYVDPTGTSPILTGVTRPDNSKWTFSGGVANSNLPPVYTGYVSCTNRSATNDLSQTPFVFTVVAPSGVQGRFEQKIIHHGRSYVPSDCRTDPFGGERYEDIFPIFSSYALTKRTLSGPGIGTQDWTYGYPAIAVGSTTSDPCASAGTCAETASMGITDPAGNLTRHTFSIRAALMGPVRWSANEGKELKTEWYQGTSTLLRTRSIEYAQPNGGPYPSRIGSSFDLSHVNTVKLETWSPQDRIQLTQQGVTFTHDVTAFDGFARPNAVTDVNTQNPSKSTVTSYHDNQNDWVLGQVASSTVNGTVVSQASYTAKDQPSQTKSFGKVQQTLSYNADGTLHTVADGNGNTTTFSNWKRGIPGKITYADATFQFATINDIGQITSTTDEVDAMSCYGYDTSGRLNKITYPSETSTGVCDTSAWNATLRTFSFVAGAYGLPSHWRLWERTGNGYKLTHYDALWRPVIEEARDNADIANTRSIVVKRYDAAGRLAFQSYPLRSLSDWTSTALKGVQTTYDALDRVTKVEQDSELGVLATTTAYLSNTAGYYTKVTDPKGHVTRTWYQAFDQPTYDAPLRIDQPEHVRTWITRDVFGKPTAVTREAY